MPRARCVSGLCDSLSGARRYIDPPPSLTHSQGAEVTHQKFTCFSYVTAIPARSIFAKRSARHGGATGSPPICGTLPGHELNPLCVEFAEKQGAMDVGHRCVKHISEFKRADAPADGFSYRLDHRRERGMPYCRPACVRPLRVCPIESKPKGRAGTNNFAFQQNIWRRLPQPVSAFTARLSMRWTALPCKKRVDASGGPSDHRINHWTTYALNGLGASGNGAAAWLEQWRQRSLFTDTSAIQENASHCWSSTSVHAVACASARDDSAITIDGYAYSGPAPVVKDLRWTADVVIDCTARSRQRPSSPLFSRRGVKGRRLSAGLRRPTSETSSMAVNDDTYDPQPKPRSSPRAARPLLAPWSK